MTKTCKIPSLDTPHKWLNIDLDGDMYLSTCSMLPDNMMTASSSVRMHNPINGGGRRDCNDGLYAAAQAALNLQRQNGRDIFTSPGLTIAPDPRDIQVVRYIASGPHDTMPIKFDILSTPDHVGVNIWRDFADNKPCLDDTVWIAKNSAAIKSAVMRHAIPDKRQKLFGNLFLDAAASDLDPFQTFQNPIKGTAHALDY